MRVIDISNHQAGIDLAAVPCDGVVVKATEGRGYQSPAFTAQVTSARDAGKKVAFYHFASTGNTAALEAANFVATIKPLDDGNPVVLDWEQTWTDDVPYWCGEWWDRVANALGRAPLLYLNLSTAQRDGWGWALPNRAGLWLAQYPTSVPVGGWGIADADRAWPDHAHEALTHGDASPWQVAMWQYTNKGRLTGHDGNLDLNTGSLWEG